MTKAPVAGNVKTRLMPRLSARECARLAECLFLDTLAKVKILNLPIIIAHESAGDKNYFAQFPDENIFLVAQKGKDLGARICAAFEFASALGAEAIVMIGTDSPTFPLSSIENAFSELEAETQVVFGKTPDGGFYLVGLKKPDARIFDNVEWSTAKTFVQTKANCDKSILRLAEVAEWYDLDEVSDLENLFTEFCGSIAAREIAPRTFEFTKVLLDKSLPSDQSFSRD